MITSMSLLIIITILLSINSVRLAMKNSELYHKNKSSENDLLSLKKEISKIRSEKVDSCSNYVLEIERLERRIEEFRSHNKALNQKVINLKREIRKINEFQN